MKIEKKNFDLERSLYKLKNSEVMSCTFSGKNDGESPLKETDFIYVNDCSFDLRYALWHNRNSNIEDCTFSALARAPFWYGKNNNFLNVVSNAPKAFRECKNLVIKNSKIISEEPFWKINKIYANSCVFSGFYGFFNCKNVCLDKIEFDGKYSFQYCSNVRIKNSTLNTKDAFWHSQNVKVENSVIKGEYIGWYSKNLTFVNCTIESHQGFCYSSNIKFIDCKMPNSDLVFEKSGVRGNIVGSIYSIKNPKRIKLSVEGVGELIEVKKKMGISIHNNSKSNV